MCPIKVNTIKYQDEIKTNFTTKERRKTMKRAHFIIASERQNEVNLRGGNSFFHRHYGKVEEDQ